MEQLRESNKRIDVADALRGFAVMAILLVHNVEHFIFPVYPTNSPEWLNTLDQGVFNTVFSLFSGKAYAIFAILFGFTFHIQTDNQRRKGKDFGYRYLWRLLLLVGFATLNAAFFPGGDVLLLFVVAGLVLFLTRKWTDKALLITALLFLLQPVEWFHYFASLIDPAYRLPNLGIDEMYVEITEYVKAGSLSEFLLKNITLGQKASLLWAVSVGRFFQTVGLFMLGFYMGRKELFICSDKNIRIWITILIASALSFAPLSALNESMRECEPIVRQTAGAALDMWQKLAFTLVLITSFLLLYRNAGFGKAVESLRFYGRMSLTNYIFQSVIGALIYFPIGLYLAPYCGQTVSLLIGLSVFFLQLRFCKWWLSGHKQGPLEYIWHKWTWIGK